MECGSEVHSNKIRAHLQSRVAEGGPPIRCYGPDPGPGPIAGGAALTRPPHCKGEGHCATISALGQEFNEPQTAFRRMLFRRRLDLAYFGRKVFTDFHSRVRRGFQADFDPRIMGIDAGICRTEPLVDTTNPDRAESAARCRAEKTGNLLCFVPH